MASKAVASNVAFGRCELLLVSKSKPKVKIRTENLSIVTLIIIVALSTRSVAGRPRESVPSEQPLERLVPAAGSTSELSFEYLNLNQIPSGQLCKLELHGQVVNSVSFASNQIESLKSSAFICVSLRLKILNLRNNKIETISDEAFKGLEQLQVLLLDGNQLNRLPWRQLASSNLPSLRHLNLAHNRIGSIGADEPLEGSNLISLDLRGNPLRQIDRRSLSALTRLKTLTISEVELTASQLDRFDGLAELSFVHLNRLGANLSAIDKQFCDLSRKLATLSLKWNQIELVPEFTSCQGLLSLDLSYNRIGGTLKGNFSQLTNLIDLYLGHNQLEHLEEGAFVGLTKLQVLELNSNRIKTIHSECFVPLRGTLYELNIANNIELSELTSQGLEQLISLKSYGNNQLRRLPAEFHSARLLVLTFAYHCCDYYHQEPNFVRESAPIPRELNDGNHPTDQFGRGNSLADNFEIHRPVESDQDEEGERPATSSSFAQWSHLIWTKLANLWQRQDDGPAARLAGTKLLARPDETNPRNVSELVLWRPMGVSTLAELGGGGGSRKRARATYSAAADNLNDDDDEYFRASNLHQRRSSLTSSAEVVPVEELARPKPKLRAKRVTTQFARKISGVIDELVWRVSKIRLAHRDQLDGFAEGSGQMGAMTSRDDDEMSEQFQADDELELIQAAALPNNELFLRLRAKFVGRELAQELTERHSTAIDKNDFKTAWGRISKRATAQTDGQDNRPHSIESNRRRHSTPARCLPKPDAFQPCRDLFDSIWLRASIWLVFLFAFAGNILVIVVLGSVRPSSSASALTSIMWSNAAQSKRHIDVPRFLVINLAVADLLMAIYLGFLAFIDLSTLGEFRLHAIRWQYSTGCKLAGFLAVLSSELSVFILAIITLERNYAITNAVHLNRRLSLQKAMMIMFFGYVYALAMAILPLNGVNDYRKFSICLPLDFDANNLKSASSLYLILLISINTLSFFLLLSCYLRMYCAIRGSQAWSTNDLKIAKRMSILVATDFLCWSPIIVVAILALFGHYFIGSEGLKVLIIFVLPLNSVANPFLYAITTKKFKRDLATLKKRLRVEQAAGMLYRLFAAGCLWRNSSSGSLKQPSGRGGVSWSIRGEGNNQCDGNRAKTDRRLLAENCRNKQARCKVDFAKRIGGNLHECRLTLDETRAVSSSKSRRTRQEMMLVNQRGRSVLLNGAGFETTTVRHLVSPPLRTQFRSPSANGQFDQSDFLPHASGQVVTHCAACHSRIVKLNNNTLAAELQLDSSSSEQFQPAGPVGLASDSSIGYELQKRAGVCFSQVSSRPRIVLESVEPVVDVALAPLQLADRPCSRSENSSSINKLPAGRKVSSSEIINHRTANEDNKRTRASSADKCPEVIRPHLLSLIVSHVDNPSDSPDALKFQQENRRPVLMSSCQTVLEDGQLHQHKVSLASFKNSPDDNNNNNNNRSVSACAYAWPVPTNQLVGGNKNFLSAATAPRVHCSCSWDTLQLRRENAGACPSHCQPVGLSSASRLNSIKFNHQRRELPRARTRSISRFVIDPLAKAWSSLQLSFQTGHAPTTTTTTLAATSTAVTTTNAAASNQPHLIATSTNVNPFKCSTSELPRCRGTQAVDANHCELESESTESHELLVDLNGSSIIEDVLQMGSPKRRLLFQGRRMSRSCDVIVETSTTSTTTEPTGSSFYDQNNDQRILLATINQLNSRGRKRRTKQMSFEQHQANHNQQVIDTGRANSGRRPNCTRCRSWSPALLDKLEDCMHHIRNRIPKFSNNDDNNNAINYTSGHLEVDQGRYMESFDVCSGTCNPQQVQTSTSELQQNLGQPLQCSPLSSSSSSSVNMSEQIDDEEDEFNEIGLADWTRNMQKKAPPNCYSKSVSRRQRLRQQLSGNSDTLSIRTAGTTMTSVSFDSSSNIPTTPSGCLENTVQHPVSSSSSPTVSNNNENVMKATQ